MWLSRKTSGGWVVSASALGTGGELGRHPEGFSRLGVLGDTWHSPKVRPKGLSGWLSGHVALSEGFRRRFRRSFGVAFGRASGWLRKGFSVGLREHVAYSEGLRKGSFGVALPEGGLSVGFSPLD